VYYRNISVIRQWLAGRFLNPLVKLWLYEASLISGYLDGQEQLDTVDGLIDWYWTGAEHVDPLKEANAQDVHIKNNSTTYAAEYAKQGKDWLQEFEQIAREKETMKKLGITQEVIANVKDDKSQSDDEKDDEQSDDAKRNARIRVG
jgi:capsid protein